jgi:hypothetical protein
VARLSEPVGYHGCDAADSSSARANTARILNVANHATREVVRPVPMHRADRGAVSEFASAGAPSAILGTRSNCQPVRALTLVVRDA